MSYIVLGFAFIGLASILKKSAEAIIHVYNCSEKRKAEQHQAEWERKFRQIYG